MEFASVLVITLVVIACFAFFRTSKVKVTIDYDNDGKKQEGKRDGLWTNWHANGQKEMEDTFKAGKQEGPQTWSHENGQKERAYTSKEGKPDGLVTVWDENGNVIAQTIFIFKDGKAP